MLPALVQVASFLVPVLRGGSLPCAVVQVEAKLSLHITRQIFKPCINYRVGRKNT